MKKVVAIGIQDFESMRINNRFYVDKTDFIREWWLGGDVATPTSMIDWSVMKGKNEYGKRTE